LSTRKELRHSALVLVDVVNALNFAKWPQIVRYGIPMAKRLAALKRWMKAAGAPVIYANDNFSNWKADFSELFDFVVNKTRGAPIAEMLAPEHDDYFILKPKHSAFYLTPLELLLKQLKICNLVIGGIQTDMCVLLTAHDAHMRDFSLAVPSDCCSSEKIENHRWALTHLRNFLEADTRSSRLLMRSPASRGAAARL